MTHGGVSKALVRAEQGSGEVKTDSSIHLLCDLMNTAFCAICLQSNELDDKWAWSVDPFRHSVGIKIGNLVNELASIISHLLHRTHF